jgi:ribosome-associated toxin RatA of RatAB toxin-antitoxin module
MRYRALFLALVIVATWRTDAKSLWLNPTQLERLDRGEVVLLDVLPPGATRGAVQGGTALARVHASPETVWRVLVDYRRHPGLYPRVVDTEVLRADLEHALVRYVVGVGPLFFGFHVNNYVDAARRRIEWRLAQERRNDLFRDSWGYWQIEPRGPDVVLTYAMAARTVLPAFVTRGAERDGLVETLKAVRERAEQAR